jgi:transposase InsO family protein
VRFAFIHEEKAFPIDFMCRQLEVSRSGYYAWRDREASSREQRDDELVPLMRSVFDQYPRGCGSRMLVGALKNAGHSVSRKRVVRLMAEHQMRHRLKRRFARTTDSRHKKRAARNVLKRDFTVGLPNKAWASDITYLPTRRGWVYLAVVIDLGTRKVVGWSVGRTMEQELVLRALRDAIFERRPEPGLVHHSDRGVQYASDEYRALLAEHEMVCSMSRKGNCWDNAVVESFFACLKREMRDDDIAADWRDAERRVFSYIAGHYNSSRLHSALDYVTPNRYEEMQAAA